MGRRPDKINDASCSFEAKIVGFADGYELNDRFDVRKVSVISWEDIANRFHFSKDVIDSKDYQLDMLPVVGFHDGEGFTSHDERAVPYGAVIPNSAKWEFVDGKEYKVVDVAFWKERYNEQLKDLVNCNQSLEAVGISGVYNKQIGVFEVEDYSYDALCVLHENTDPAFPNAKVFSLSDIKDEFNIFKEEFSAMFNNVKEKGVDNVDNENIQDNVESFENEDTTTGVEDVTMGNAEDSTEVETENNVETTDMESGTDESFELSHQNIRDLLSNKLDNHDDKGYRKYDIYVCDVFETYCIYSKWDEDNKFYKASYAVNGNDVTIGESIMVYARFLTQEEIDVLDKKDEQFNELTENYSVLTTEVETLRQFKSDIEKKDAEIKAEMELNAKNEAIAKFEKKLSKKEINEVIDDVANFSLDEINTKLSVVLAGKLLSSDETFADKKIVNIDTVDKTYSREERLVAELKSKRK